MLLWVGSEERNLIYRSIPWTWAHLKAPRKGCYCVCYHCMARNNSDSHESSHLARGCRGLLSMSPNRDSTASISQKCQFLSIIYVRLFPIERACDLLIFSGVESISVSQNGYKGLEPPQRDDTTEWLIAPESSNVHCSDPEPCKRHTVVCAACGPSMVILELQVVEDPAGEQQKSAMRSRSGKK